MSTLDRALEEQKWKEKEYLYTVLNLPVYASDSDIKDRHRSLSLVFHPDKQRDERAKEVAQQKFLEIQRAYEILCDPWLRAVYDTLGYEGLSIKWPVEYRHLPPNELNVALRSHFFNVKSAQLESLVNPQGTLTCVFDIRELFYDGWLAREWYTDLSERIAATKLAAMSLRHSISKQLNPLTRLQVISKIDQSSQDEPDDDGTLRKMATRRSMLRGNVTGIIKHSYSPKIQLEARASLIQPHSLSLTSTYSEESNQFSATVLLRPALLRSRSLPPVVIDLRRRLFRDSLTIGVLQYTLDLKVPAVYAGLVKPTVPRKGARVAAGWACGLNLRVFGGPGLFAEWQMQFTPLFTDVKLALDYSILGGLAATLLGSWNDERKEMAADAAVTSSPSGIQLRMSLTYLGQTLVLPINFADEYTPLLSLFATALPATAFLVVDYFSLRYRRRIRDKVRKIQHQKAEEDFRSNKRQEAEMVLRLLTESAHRIMQSEKEGDGLVVLEASYFPVEDDGRPMPDLGINVTIPVQAMVHKGQIFIPGGRSKAALRGFFDPLPDCRKRLSVRYEFHGRLHYAEVHDLAPVVLPLESHLVEKAGN